MSDVSAEKARVVFLFVCGDRNLARALWLKVLIFDTLCRCAFRVWCVSVCGWGVCEWPSEGLFVCLKLLINVKAAS